MDQKKESASASLEEIGDLMKFFSLLALLKVSADISEKISEMGEKKTIEVKPYEMKSSDMKTGDYIITSEKIGEGGYGKVFKAYKVGGSKVFVAKEQQITKWAESEIVSMKFLANEPFVVGLIDVVYEEEKVFTIMEYCNQGSLRDILLKKKSIPEKDAVQIIDQLARLFYHIKAEKNIEIIHRDLKPENLLFHDGRLKIGDWGLSKLHHGFNKGLSTSKALNEYYSYCGTRNYVSPEIEHSMPYNSKTDVYSAGIILAECVGIKNLGYPLDDPLFEKLSPHTQHLLKKMLALDPFERFSWEDVCKCSENINFFDLGIMKTMMMKSTKFSFL